MSTPTTDPALSPLALDLHQAFQDLTEGELTDTEAGERAEALISRHGALPTDGPAAYWAARIEQATGCEVWPFAVSPHDLDADDEPEPTPEPEPVLPPGWLPNPDTPATLQCCDETEPVPKLTADQAKALIREALTFWRGIAAKNGGWTVEGVQVWVNPDGTAADSLYVKGGRSLIVLTASRVHGDDCQCREAFLGSIPTAEVA